MAGPLAVTSYSTIYEDNSACLSQANLPKLTPLTKHIAVSYHWFREYVLSAVLRILKIDTAVTPPTFLPKVLLLRNLQLFANLSVVGDILPPLLS